MRELTVAVAALSVVVSSALAEENVLFEVLGKDKVLGTLRPASESEVIRGRLARGTVLTASAKSIDKTGPVPSIEVRKDGAPVAGVAVTPKGRGVATAPFTVAESGTYEVVVSGDGVKDGDYLASVSWKPQKAFAGTGTSAGETTFGFAAPARSFVSVALAPGKGSAFVPNLIALDGPMGATVALSGGAKASRVALPVGGDWRVRFSTGVAEGEYRVSVKVAAPAVAKHQADIRDGALSGEFSGGPLVNGAVIDADAGGTLAVSDPDSPISGSSVTVPPDSLGKTTSIFVAETSPYVPPGGDLPAGPAVEFGPSGTQFDSASPATVTIPFDPGAFPAGTSSLVVYVKSADGTVTPVLPTSAYVIGPGTVTFTTSHFSAFQAATSADRGPPRGLYEFLRITGRPTTDIGGEVSVITGQVNLGDGFIGGNVNASVLRFSSPAASGPSSSTVERTLTFEGSVSQTDDTTTQVNAMSGPFRLRRGATNDVLVMEHDDATELGAGIFVKRTAGEPTFNTLAGRWHAFVFEFAVAGPAGGQIRLLVCAVAGTATIGEDGSTQMAFKGNSRWDTSYPGGDWQAQLDGDATIAGAVGFDSERLPTFAFAGQPAVNLVPALDGDLLFARFMDVDTELCTAPRRVGALLLVRESSGVSAAAFLGTFVDVDGGVEVHVVDGNPPPNRLGLDWRARTGTVGLGPGTAYGRASLFCRSGYTTSETASEHSTSPDGSAAGATFKLSPNGALAVTSENLVGGALPGGAFAVYLRRSSATIAPGFLLRLPPVQ